MPDMKQGHRCSEKEQVRQMIYLYQVLKIDAEDHLAIMLRLLVHGYI